MYGLDMEADDLDTHDVETRDGRRVTYDRIDAEVIKMHIDGRDVMLQAGSTYSLNNRIVYRDWPTADEVIQKIAKACHD